MNIKWICFLSLIFTGMPLSCVAANVTLQEEPLPRLRDLMQSHQLDQAEKQATIYLQQDPHNTDVRLMLGLIYYQQQKYVAAEEVLTQVLKTSPHYLDAKIALIRVKVLLKKNQVASQLLNEVIKTDPDRKEVKEIKTFYEQQVQQFKVKEDTLGQIRLLVQQKKLTLAKTKAHALLKRDPNDVDAMLFLGIIAYQQYQMTLAEKYFNQVIAKSPDYTDAKIGLIRVKLATHDLAGAKKWLDAVERAHPQNPELKNLKVIYEKELKLQQERLEQIRLEHKLACIKRKVDCGHINTARRIINDALNHHPCDADYLYAKGYLLYHSYLLAQSAKACREALAINPQLKPATALLATIKEINPHLTYGVNDIGLWTMNEYVSDLNAIWDYTTLYYGRGTSLGQFYARLNYAARLGVQATQEEIEFLPLFSKNLYFDLLANYSNEPELFPRYSVALEGYGTFGNWFTLSLGDHYSYIIKATYFQRYTASISRSTGNYWLSFRTNHYVPNAGSSSTLYIFNIRRYFNTQDFYLNLGFGMGRSPDLSDLITLDFIVIRNRFANLNLRIPIFNHRALLDVGTDYQNWKYPSGLVRNLYGIKLGIDYRF